MTNLLDEKSAKAERELPELSAAETLRYSRHLLLPEVGLLGQRKLKASRVLIIGAGGLGSPVAYYLAAAGVGNLGIVDDDVVDESNLQRQILFEESDVGKSKSEVAKRVLLGLNSMLNVEVHKTRLVAANAMEMMSKYDVIIDGTDNFSTRYLVNDCGVFLKKPIVYGSIFRFEGQASVFDAQRGPCYRCVYPEAPPPDQVPNCAEGGVLGVLPGFVGVVQATECIKVILGVGESLIGRLAVFDALGMSMQSYRIRKNKACPVCGENPSILEPRDTVQSCSVGEPKMQIEEIDVKTFSSERQRNKDIYLLDVRGPEEQAICKIAGSVLIPLPELPTRLGEIPKDKNIVVHCKAGGRSAKATELLLNSGFKNVKNLKGGILAWIAEVDPSLQKY